MSTRTWALIATGLAHFGDPLVVARSATVRGLIARSAAGSGVGSPGLWIGRLPC